MTTATEMKWFKVRMKFNSFEVNESGDGPIFRPFIMTHEDEIKGFSLDDAKARASHNWDDAFDLEVIA